jgi:hypothetical protein
MGTYGLLSGRFIAAIMLLVVALRFFTTNKEPTMKEFLSEDDLLTFDGWLEFKGLNPSSASQ